MIESDKFRVTSMPTEEPTGLTELLRRWSGGKWYCANDLFPLIQHELRDCQPAHATGTARPSLADHCPDQRSVFGLVNQTQVNWQNRAHFFGITARLMREILVDHARGCRREKRGGGEPMLTLEQVLDLSAGTSTELVALDEALHRLDVLDPRKSQVVELRHLEVER